MQGIQYSGRGSKWTRGILCCGGATANGLLLGDGRDEDNPSTLSAGAVDRSTGATPVLRLGSPTVSHGWVCPRKQMVLDTLKPTSGTVEIRPSWRACRIGVLRHSLRGAIIPKPATRVGIRRAAYRNGFRDIENPSQGRLLGDYPLSPRNDHFCEDKIMGWYHSSHLTHRCSTTADDKGDLPMIGCALERGPLIVVFDQAGRTLLAKTKGSGPKDGLLGLPVRPSPWEVARSSTPTPRNDDLRQAA
jgi:hypothetical protein